MKKMIRFAFLVMAAAGVFPSPAMAKSARIAIPGISGTLLPLYVTQDEGFFKKYGLDTELIMVRAGSVAVQSLLAGEIQFAASGASSGIEARLAGADMVSIADYMNTLPYTLVASPKMRSAEQLRGKKFAVSRLGSISDIALRLALKNLGIDPGKEAVILGIGDAASRFSALQVGSVDATVISPPDTLTARRLGFNRIASFQEAGVKFAYGSIFIAGDFGRKSRDVVMNFLRGFTEGIAYIHKNKAGSLKILGRWTRNKDPEALEETYQFFQKLYPRKPYSLNEAIQPVLDVIAEGNPKARKFKPEDFYNMQYLRELDQSGFIENLYK